MIEPVRPIASDDIDHARTRIAGTVLRTPLVKLDLGSGAPDIHLKLENLADQRLQDTRCGQCRCALIRSRALVAYGRSAQAMQGKASLMPRGSSAFRSVVAIETAPQTKLDRMARARCDHRSRLL